MIDGACSACGGVKGMTHFSPTADVPLSIHDCDWVSGGPPDLDCWKHMEYLLNAQLSTVSWQLDRLGNVVVKAGRPYHLFMTQKEWLSKEKLRITRLIRESQEQRRAFEELLSVQAHGSS